MILSQSSINLSGYGKNLLQNLLSNLRKDQKSHNYQHMKLNLRNSLKLRKILIKFNLHL